MRGPRAAMQHDEGPVLGRVEVAEDLVPGLAWLVDAVDAKIYFSFHVEMQGAMYDVRAVTWSYTVQLGRSAD